MDASDADRLKKFYGTAPTTAWTNEKETIEDMLHLNADLDETRQTTADRRKTKRRRGYGRFGDLRRPTRRRRA